MNPLEEHKKAALDAKLNHLSIKLVRTYAFNRDNLSQIEITQVEEHITSCERCKFNSATLLKVGF
jgi:hypothetical protein